MLFVIYIYKRPTGGSARDKWAEKWQLTLNAETCKVMHIGVENQKRSYEMMKRGKVIVLEKTIIEKDMGVNVDNQLKFSNHMQVNKGNKLLGLIRRSFTYLYNNSMLIMYKTLVRPLIEYGHTIIYPRYEKDKKLIEGVQRLYRSLRTKNTQIDYKH